MDFCTLAKKSFEKTDLQSTGWCKCTVHQGTTSDTNPIYQENTYTGKTDNWVICNSQGDGWNCDCSAICVKFE